MWAKRPILHAGSKPVAALSPPCSVVAKPVGRKNHRARADAKRVRLRDPRGIVLMVFVGLGALAARAYRPVMAAA